MPAFSLYDQVGLIAVRAFAPILNQHLK